MTSKIFYSNQINTKSFGFEWETHIRGKIEKNRVFGRTSKEEFKYFLNALGIIQSDIRNKKILDAGCGSGKLTCEISKYKPSVIYGIDIHSAIPLVEKKYKNIPNIKIQKADIFDLPFKNNYFDFVWCNGVIHHTSDPHNAFKKLTEIVKPGGKLYVWVYEKGFSPYKFTKDIFRFSHVDSLPYPVLFRICQVFSFLSILLHKTYQAIAKIFYPICKHSKYFLKTLRNRSYEEFLMTWFDALSPKYDYRFTKEEIAKWFKNNGFTDLRYYWDQIGICGTKK